MRFRLVCFENCTAGMCVGSSFAPGCSRNSVPRYTLSSDLHIGRVPSGEGSSFPAAVVEPKVKVLLRACRSSLLRRMTAVAVFLSYRVLCEQDLLFQRTESWVVLAHRRIVLGRRVKSAAPLFATDGLERGGFAADIGEGLVRVHYRVALHHAKKCTLEMSPSCGR